MNNLDAWENGFDVWARNSSRKHWRLMSSSSNFERAAYDAAAIHGRYGAEFGSPEWETAIMPAEEVSGASGNTQRKPNDLPAMR